MKLSIWRLRIWWVMLSIREVRNRCSIYLFANLWLRRGKMERFIRFRKRRRELLLFIIWIYWKFCRKVNGIWCISSGRWRGRIFIRFCRMGAVIWILISIILVIGIWFIWIIIWSWRMSRCRKLNSTFRRILRIWGEFISFC